jgi:hypothetical protein
MQYWQSNAISSVVDRLWELKMPEPKDLVIPILREMRKAIDERFDGVDAQFKQVNQTLEKIDARQKNFSNALTADTMMSKFMAGDFEERIEALEKKVDQILKIKS